MISHCPAKNKGATARVFRMTQEVGIDRGNVDNSIFHVFIFALFRDMFLVVPLCINCYLCAYVLVVSSKRFANFDDEISLKLGRM